MILLICKEVEVWQTSVAYALSAGFTVYVKGFVTEVLSRFPTGQAGMLQNMQCTVT